MTQPALFDKRPAARARAAEVLIVGAGVVGASIAWHLATLGVRPVVLLERETGVGQGSTGRATGGFRAQFATRIHVELSLLAREKLLRFREEVGADPGYRPAGYLWLAHDEAELALLRAANAVQRAAGLAEARLVGPDEARALNPAILPRDGLLGGAFCPTDGFLRPEAILHGYLAASRALGVSFETGARVLGVTEVPGGRSLRVHTTAGDWEAPWVIDAAGPWAAEVARLAGVEIPVVPLRRQVAVIAPGSGLPEDMPMTIFVEDGFHLRVRDGRVLLLWPTPGDPADPWDARVEDAWVAEVARKAGERIAGLAAARIERERCWAGLYEMTPDRHAIVGTTAACPRLLLACGNSGHGVMHAPALAQLVAELVVHGEARALDATPLRPDRFSGGSVATQAELL